MLLHQYLSLTSIDWGAPWHRNNICELLKWVAFFPLKKQTAHELLPPSFHNMLLSFHKYFLDYMIACIVYFFKSICIYSMTTLFSWFDIKGGRHQIPHNYKSTSWNDTIKVSLLLYILICVRPTVALKFSAARNDQKSGV